MKTKALAPIITTLIVILLSIIAVTSIWIVIDKVIQLSPDTTACSQLTLNNALSIKRACHLNKELNEIQVRLQRGTYNFKTDMLKFTFTKDQDSAIFGLRNGKNCEDIRKLNSDYHEPCEIIKPGQTIDYVFQLRETDPEPNNLILETQTTNIQDQKISCYIEAKEIKESC